MRDLHLPRAVYCLQKLPEPIGLGSCLVAHKLREGYKHCRTAPFAEQTQGRWHHFFLVVTDAADTGQAATCVLGMQAFQPRQHRRMTCSRIQAGRTQCLGALEQVQACQAPARQPSSPCQGTMA